jgi:hypothetical protein
MSGTPILFDITTIAVDSYDHLDQLDGVIEAATEISGWFATLGGVPSEHPAAARWHETAVKKRLRAWEVRSLPSSVLLWLGHGESDGDEACLACADSPGTGVTDGYNTLSMANHLYRDLVRRQTHDSAWTLLIIDACGSGDYVRLVHQQLTKRSPRNLCMIGVSDGAGYVGLLQAAVARVFGRLTAHDERVRLDALVTDIRAEVAGTAMISDLGPVYLPRTPPVPAPICAPLDVYAELAALLETVSPDERHHFFPKFQAAEQTESGLHFVGRAAEQATIFDWLRTADRGMLVVTGRPGSGKSALLGNVLLRCSPHWQPVLARAGWLSPAEDVVFDAALNLAGLTTAEVVARLARAFRLLAPSTEDQWNGTDVALLIAGLTGRRFTILADGLDEARDPSAIAMTVLRRLADLPHGRVVVGTRASTSDEVDLPEPPDASVLAALVAAQPGIVPVTRDPEALGQYVRRRLAHDSLPEGSLRLSNAEIHHVADLVVQHSGDSGFLVARLAVHEIRADPRLARGDELPRLLAQGHQAFFRYAVDRIAGTGPYARALLTALAHIRGRGVPRSERQWALVASAFTDGRLVAESDIDALLDQAAPYVTGDAEYGMTVYRLAHESYRSVLQEERDDGR